MIRKLVLLAALVAALPTAHADDDDGPMTGNDLAEIASGYDLIADRIDFLDDTSVTAEGILNVVAGSMFLAYVRGISDVTNGHLFCADEEVTGFQLGKVVSKYLKDHPERLHEHGALLAIDAMAEAFPCAAGTGATP